MKFELLPNVDDIKKYVKKGNFLPVYIEVGSGAFTSLSCLENLKNNNEKYPFLYESLDNRSKTSRYTIIGFNPRKTFIFENESICLIEDHKYKTKKRVKYSNPLNILKKLSDQIKSIKIDNLPPLTSGLVGYLGYDNITSLYNIPKHKNQEQNYYYGYYGFYKDFVVFDNFNQGKIQIITNIYLNKNITNKEFEIKKEEAKKRINNILKIIKKPNKSIPLLLSSDKSLKIEVDSNITNEKYKDILSKLKNDLNSGRVFQTIISGIFRFDMNNISKKGNIGGITIYKALRHVNPSNYMYYFYLGEFELIGSVPETFVKIEGRKVLTKPLAGTRGVGKNIKEYTKLRNELKNDKKEKAEHSMLIDLIRNDLSVNCEPGSIKVKKKMYVKKYNYVMHLVSDVIGKISKDKDYYDIFSGIFPHGNITGAPKIKAMKLINEYELSNRGIYGGAIGYFGFNGNADFAVIIRTIIKKGNMLYNQVGSGIVVDCIPEMEIKEHQNKNKTFIEILKILYTNFK